MEHFNDLVPVLFVRSFFLGENHHSLVVFKTFEENLDFVADLKIFHVIEFGHRDDAFGFITNVNEDFTCAHFQHAAFDDTTFFEIAKTVRDELCHFDHTILF